MNVSFSKQACFKHSLFGLFITFLLLIIPTNVSSQVLAIPCSNNQSWIARWTITSIIGPGAITEKDFDGSKTMKDIKSPGQWEFNINFGIVRKLSGIKIYSASELYTPHAYEIWVKKDDITPFTLANSGSLQYKPGAFEHLLDFNGYFEAKYVKIIFKDSYITATTYSTSELRLWEINFLQCGVDPMTAKTLPQIDAPIPALSCAEGVSGNIQGIINTYYPGLSDASKGSSSLSVDVSKAKGANHALIAGDRVLIIQMQNTLICDSNSMAYGDGIDYDLIASGWTDVRNTGEYEFAIVESFSGNTIQLTQPLQKKYIANGVFQVIYSPVYDNVTLTGTVKAEYWDGYCGGIVTFDAKTLNLNNQIIDVSSQGFRKGKKNSNPPYNLYYWKFYATDNDWSCGEKGEGIAGAPKGSYAMNSRRLYITENSLLNRGGSFGRGAPGNAGGGGIGHNSGGGGGANIGSGGQGGASVGQGLQNGDMTYYWDAISPDGQPEGAKGYYPNGGMGGTGTGRPDPFRIWMGGAGAGGHQDNGAATGGSNGGGIILATARVVKGTGYFYADGVDAENTLTTNGLTGGDGAGGGGAGGTIVFGFDDPTDAKITFSVKGGKGGSVSHPVPHGPGGGGGGGAIIVSDSTANMKFIYSGGQNGVHTASQSPWGAYKGQNGQIKITNKLSALYTYSCDHGDAPRSYLDAAHLVKTDGPSLNKPGDTEPMALNLPPHEFDALGDDLNGNVDSDEDGVVLPFDTTFSTSQSNFKVNVIVNNPLNQNVYVCSWIDFNSNGRFDEGEKTYISGILNGVNELKWNNIPSDITGGETYARFRISTDPIALQPTGVAPDGEVEDYTIHINGIPQALPDDTCTHAGRSVNIQVVKNDNIQGDKSGYLTIKTNPVNGTAVIHNNNTPNDKTDDFITYTPNPGYQGPDTLTYEIWNAIGNSSKAMVTVTVKEPIDVDFKANPDEGCTPLDVSFSNLSTDKTAKFTWDFGDSTQTSQDIDPTHTFPTKDSTTVYYVKLTMNTGCGIIDTTKQITVHPLPFAIMTEKSDFEKPETVIFNDVSTNTNDRTWTLPDGRTIRGDKQISVSFDSAGTHPITLRVFNEFGCPDDTVFIHTTVFRGLYVPNAFMPES